MLCTNASDYVKQAESKVAMMEANEEQLRQRRERREADKIEEDRLVQIMFDKFKVCTPCSCRRLALLPSDVCVCC